MLIRTHVFDEPVECLPYPVCDPPIYSNTQIACAGLPACWDPPHKQIKYLSSERLPARGIHLRMKKIKVVVLSTRMRGDPPNRFGSLPISTVYPAC